MERVNLRIYASTKQELKILAAKENITMIDMIDKIIRSYKESKNESNKPK